MPGFGRWHFSRLKCRLYEGNEKIDEGVVVDSNDLRFPAVVSKNGGTVSWNMAAKEKKPHRGHPEQIDPDILVLTTGQSVIDFFSCSSARRRISHISTGLQAKDPPANKDAPAQAPVVNP